MLPIPGGIFKPFGATMEKKAISPSARADYRKWLKYYFGFRTKYPPPDSRSEQVPCSLSQQRMKLPVSLRSFPCRARRREFPRVVLQRIKQNDVVGIHVQPGN